MNKELEEAKTRLYEFIHNINLADKTIDNIKQDVYTALNYIDNSIPKELIQNKKNELEKEYKEAMERNSTKAFILKCQIEILNELPIKKD